MCLVCKNFNDAFETSDLNTERFLLLELILEPAYLLSAYNIDHQY